MSSHWPQPPANFENYLQAAEAFFAEADIYFGHGTDNAWDEAVMLGLDTLGLDWSAGREVLQQQLSAQQAERFIDLCTRRVQDRTPAAYLIGKAWFAGLEFTINDDVLVPRSPLAELIMNGFSPWLSTAPDRILDLCTGSGCIGIASGYAFPEAKIDLSDISPAAIQVAEHNVLKHNMADRVHCFTGDGFTALGDNRYDLILCNPPYVDAEDLAAMPEEYKAEPEIGLGSGSDGLDFTRQLLREAPQYLNDGGLLIGEVGNSCEALDAAYPDVPFMWVELENGGHGVFIISKEELMQHRF